MPKKSAQHKKGGFKTVGFTDIKQKQTKLALIVLLVIVVTLLLGQAVRVVNHFFQPVTEYTSFSKSYSWDGKTVLHLAIKASEVAVLSYDPVEKSLNIVNVPADTYVEVPGGYGKWQTRAVYDIGQGEKQPIGAKLLTDSMASLVGLPLNGIIEVDENNPQTPYEFIKSLKENPFSFDKKVHTNLTGYELFNFALQVSRLRLDKITELNLKDFDLLTPTKLSDGSNVLVAEPQLLDNFVIDKLSEQKMRVEQIPVAVFNGTQTPGMATKVARMITNMGGNVIISTNAPFIDSTNSPELQKSFIITSADTNSYTFKRLKQIFNLDCSNNPKCDKMYVDKITSRAQINVVVGKDFVN